MGERAVRHSPAQNRPGPEKPLGHRQLPFPFPSHLTEGLRLLALSSQMSDLAIAFSHKRPSSYHEASSYKSARRRGGTTSLPRKFLDPRSEPASGLLLNARTKAHLPGFGTVRSPQVPPQGTLHWDGVPSCASMPFRLCRPGAAAFPAEHRFPVPNVPPKSPAWCRSCQPSIVSLRSRERAL